MIKTIVCDCELNKRCKQNWIVFVFIDSKLDKKTPYKSIFILPTVDTRIIIQPNIFYPLSTSFLVKSKKFNFLFAEEFKHVSEKVLLLQDDLYFYYGQK